MKIVTVKDIVLKEIIVAGAVQPVVVHIQRNVVGVEAVIGTLVGNEMSVVVIDDDAIVVAADAVVIVL